MPLPTGQPESEVEGIRAKAKIKTALDEQTRVMHGAQPPATPTKINPPAAVDRVKPGAKYGDRPGEKRLDLSNIKPLPSYKKGTKAVPKTGPAMLHKGEAVIPAEANPMNPYTKITETEKKPKKVLKAIHTRKAKSGGYIHEHHHTEPAHHPMEEHTTKDLKGMLAHMKEHMGEPESAAGEAGESSATEAQEQAIGME